MIDMHLLALIGKRSKRAVSPVVSTILLIALTTASIGGVAVIMANINAEGLPTANTDNASIGANSATNNDISIDLSIAKLSYDLIIFVSEGKKYYTSITIQVNYTGNIYNPNYIYLIDFDIFVYGQKLDEVSSWEINQNYVIGATQVTDTQGNFAGYQQAKGTSATYVVEVADPNNQESRVFEESSFQYVAKVGIEPGVITHQFLQEEVSKVQFNNVYYNIAIIHNDQDAGDPTSGIAYWLDALSFHNGSNSLFLLFNENKDLYDVNTGVLSTLNLTAFAEDYEAVIFAEWGIHNDAAAFATYMHETGIPMMFAGSVENIDNQIDNTAQNYITGVTPNMYSGRRIRNTTNNYQFNTSRDLLLLGLSGQGEKYYIDDLGKDVADLTGTNITQFGEAHIELYSGWFTPRLEFNHTGPLLVRKDPVLNSTGLTMTYIINHASASHSQTVFRNMIFSAFHDSDRILTSPVTLNIDDWDKTISGRIILRINIIITISVLDGDIKNGTLKYFLKMDKDIHWFRPDYTASLSVAGTIINNVDYTVVEGSDFDMISLDIGALYNGDIPEGSTIIINLPASGDMRVLSLQSSYIWLNVFEWLGMDDSFGTFSESFI